jgi:hypothetical protein
MLTVSNYARLTLATLAVTGCPLAASAQSVEPPQQIYAQYSGSVLILKVADISLSAAFQDGTYSAAATFESGGLLRWFDDTNIEATTSGYRAPDSLRPYRYEHVNHASNKDAWSASISMTASPCRTSSRPSAPWANRPPMMKNAQGALDPISTLLGLMLSIQSDDADICQGRLPVFDGKARYDLRFNNAGPDDVRTRGWSGEAIRCQAFIEPISGYDEGDRPDEQETNRPVTIWLAPIESVYVPVRFRAQTRIGSINITATQLYAGDASQ